MSRRNIYFSSDEESDTSDVNKNDVSVVAPSEYDDIKETSIVNSFDESIIAGNTEFSKNASASSNGSRFTASTPRFKTPRKIVESEISELEASVSVLSVEELSDHDRSRSIRENRFDEHAMSPMSLRLVAKGDRQKLRERMFMKNIINEKTQKKESRPELTINLSPIRVSKKNDSISSLMNTDNISVSTKTSNMSASTKTSNMSIRSEATDKSNSDLCADSNEEQSDDEVFQNSAGDMNKDLSHQNVSIYNNSEKKEESSENRSILLSSGSVKEESKSIICLDSEDENTSANLKESSTSEATKLPDHLIKYETDNLDSLLSKKEKLQKMLTTIDLSKLHDGGAKIRQTVAEIEEVIPLIQKLYPTKRVSDDINGKEIEQKKVPNIVSPPKFDPSSYSRLIAHDKKRLFGGHMTEHRLQQIQSATELSIKGMHSAINSMPDETVTLPTPNGIKIELMHHQKQALVWMVWRETQNAPGGILADDMGLGKTLSTISLIVHQKNERKKRKEECKDEEDKKRREIARNMGLIPSNATLVVAPASLIYQWEAEIDKRVQEDWLNVHIFHGPKNKRESDPRRLARYDIIITTYNLLATELTEKISTKNNQDDVDTTDGSEDSDGVGHSAVGTQKKNKKIRKLNGNSVLAKIAFDRIILDEAHQIKNKATTASRAACRLSGRNHWCLTGTPIHNNLWDLYSLIRFLRVSPFDDDSLWKEYIMGSSQKCADRLNLLTKSLLLRRTKIQTCNLTKKPLLDLQPKVVEQHEIVLEGIEGQIYDIMFRASQQKVKQLLSEADSEKHEKLYGYHRKQKTNTEEMKNPFNFGTRNISGDKFQAMSCMLVLLLRLRQACVHMHLTKESIDMEAFEHLGGDKDDADNFLERTLAELTLSDENYAENTNNITAQKVFERSFISSKLKKVIEIIDNTTDIGDKIVVVSQWTSLLILVENHLRTRGTSYTSITGKVLPADRQPRVDDFNKESKGAQVLLLSLTAGGVGLNLVGGNHLIMVDLHWNPQLEAQACDRIYRMGQKKTVYIHRLIATGTIEQRVLDLQEKKLQLAGSVLDGAASRKMNKLTMQDLKFLFQLDEDKVKKVTHAQSRTGIETL